MMENRYDAVVVGGGIAGLTAAAYLARAGRNVLLIEKNDEVGGLVNTFWRDGFRFDAGVRALEDAGIIRPMMRDLGIRLETVPSPVSLGIEGEVLHVENLASLDAYRDLLKRFYPESGREIDALIRIIRRIMKHMDVLYGVENPMFKDLRRDRAFLFGTLLPWLPRFLLTVGRINRMQFPVEDCLASLISNPSLRDLVSQHFFKNTPTFFALSYFSLYLDYFYFKGGVGTLAEALRDRILDWGGDIRTGTRVTSVSPTDRTALDDKGGRYRFRSLVWAADLKTLYGMIDPDALPPGSRAGFEDKKAAILAGEESESVFTLFLEVDEPLESFRRIAHGHFFYTPSRKGLGETHRSDLAALLGDFSRVGKEALGSWLDRFTALNTYEISIPGLKDGTMVPPGKTGLIVSFLADYELFEKVEEAGWLGEFVSGLEDRVIRVLSGSIYPMLRDKVIGRFSFTPLSIRARIASSGGAIVGWKFRKDLPVIHEIQAAARSVRTPLPSVYQAGQWAYSPAGVPMSILTGKLAADAVLKGKRT